MADPPVEISPWLKGSCFLGGCVTSVTKCTLTGVVGRLEDKGRVQQLASETDGRSQVVRLTDTGTALYERTFPEHLVFIKRIFNDYAPEEIAALEAALLRLHKTVVALRGEGSATKSFE